MIPPRHQQSKPLKGVKRMKANKHKEINLPLDGYAILDDAFVTLFKKHFGHFSTAKEVETIEKNWDDALWEVWLDGIEGGIIHEVLHFLVLKGLLKGPEKYPKTFQDHIFWVDPTEELTRSTRK